MATKSISFEQYLSLKRTHPCKFYTLQTQRQMYLDQKRMGESFFHSFINKDTVV